MPSNGCVKRLPPYAIGSTPAVTIAGLEGQYQFAAAAISATYRGREIFPTRRMAAWVPEGHVGAANPGLGPEAAAR